MLIASLLLSTHVCASILDEQSNDISRYVRARIERRRIENTNSMGLFATVKGWIARPRSIVVVGIFPVDEYTCWTGNQLTFDFPEGT